MQVRHHHVANPLDDHPGTARDTDVTPTESLEPAIRSHCRESAAPPARASGRAEHDLQLLRSRALRVVATGRSVIALRALGARVERRISLPPTALLRRGSLTVRGYPTRRRSSSWTVIHWARHRGAARNCVSASERTGHGRVVDAGCHRTTKPFSGTLSIGFGTGIRYYTPIDPSVWTSVSRCASCDRLPFVEVYVGLGQVF